MAKAKASAAKEVAVAMVKALMSMTLTRLKKARAAKEVAAKEVAVATIKALTTMTPKKMKTPKCDTVV